MLGKMILPMLGGAPSVWNTCMVFFQGMLLVGYSYAHVSTRLLAVRSQAATHLCLLLLPILTLPITIPHTWIPPVEDNPTLWLLTLLFVSVGLPFFVVSTNVPTLQKWFADTSHPSAKDPYFLYGASNLGSMLALLGYPTLVEPNLRLAEQSWLWAVGYVLLILLIFGCAYTLLRSPLVTTKDLSSIVSIESEKRLLISSH